MDERDEKGRFKEGHPGTGGRPPKARELAILQIGKEVVTLERWREIFEKAFDDAIKDPDGRTRDKARRFLAEYFIGKPAQTVRIRTDDSDDIDEFNQYSDDELRAIVAEAQDRSEDGTEGTT